MSHVIYTTTGFVLKSVNFSEANKYFFIFTKDFGLITATAQGVRYLKSKLRYGLENFCLSQISIVRGREVWRITNAEKIFSLSDSFKKMNSEKLLVLSRVFSLLLRLLHGEERNDFLFESLKEGMIFLEQENLTEESMSNLECILALRILSSLGYIGKLADFDRFTTSPYFTFELLSAMSILKFRAISEINKSLKETQL